MSSLNFNAGQNLTGRTSLEQGAGFISPEAIVDSFGLQPGMRVADFGCGSGHFTLLMAKKVGPSSVVTGLDILESALEVVRAKAAADGLNNLQTIRTNLEVLGSSGLSDQSQDLVLVANILFQAEKKGEILKEAHRVLAPGGSLVVIEWKKEGAGLGPPSMRRLGDEEVKIMAKETGFSFAKEVEAGTYHFGLLFKK